MAVSKKFRWTDENGEMFEVEFGADGENVDVNGTPLLNVISSLQTSNDKSLKYMGLCDSTKSINDYNTDDAFGIWQIGAGCTPTDMPIGRVANENVLLIVSKAYGNGTHCKQELIYTTQNIILNRIFGTEWNSWQFGATTATNTKSGGKFVTFNAGTKGELSESEYSADMFLRSDTENESGAFANLTVAYPAVAAKTAAEKFTSGAYYDARTATSTSWSPVTASEGQEGVCQIIDYEADCCPYWIKTEGDIILPERFGDVVYYNHPLAKFNFRIVVIADIPNDTNTRTIISLFNGNTTVQRRGTYGLRIVSKYGVNGNSLITSDYITNTGLLAIAIEGSNAEGTMTLTVVPIGDDFSGWGTPATVTAQITSPAYIGATSYTSNYISNRSENPLNIYSLYLETAFAFRADTLSDTSVTDIITSMRRMFVLSADNVASVGYVNEKTSAINNEIDAVEDKVDAAKNEIDAVDERLDTKADKQTIAGGFVAGRNAEVSVVEGTALEYLYIGQYKLDGEKISYVSGNPNALVDKNNTDVPVNSASQIFNVFDLGKETNISSIKLYVSDLGADGANMVCLENSLPKTGDTRNDILRTNGIVQNGVPIIENKLSTDGFINVGYTDGQYIGKYRYIIVYNWSNICTASEIYAETDTTETPIPAIQLGEGKNENPHTMQVYEYQLLDENGNIPAERLTNSVNYSTIPQKIGTWIDETPVWRVAFETSVTELMVSDKIFNIFPNVKVIKSALDIVYIPNASCDYFPQNAATYADARLVTKEGPLNYILPSTAQVGDVLRGYVEFVTPESNIVT